MIRSRAKLQARVEEPAERAGDGMRGVVSRALNRNRFHYTMLIWALTSAGFTLYAIAINSKTLALLESCHFTGISYSTIRSYTIAIEFFATYLFVTGVWFAILDTKEPLGHAPAVFWKQITALTILLFWPSVLGLAEGYRAANQGIIIDFDETVWTWSDLCDDNAVGSVIRVGSKCKIPVRRRRETKQTPILVGRESGRMERYIVGHRS